MISPAWSKLLFVALVGACARSPQLASQPAERPRFQLAPSGFGRTLSLQQRVQVILPDRTTEFDAVLNITPDTVTLIALALGQRVLTLRYDGRVLTEVRAPSLPAEVRGREIMSDMQLALWPAVSVRAALPAGWTLADETGRRTLSQGAQVIIVISYDAQPRWAGQITIESTMPAYRLVIRSVPASP